MKTKCSFTDCNKKANSDFALKINGKNTPLCSEHGEYTAMRMMGVSVEEIKAREKSQTIKGHYAKEAQTPL